MGLGPVYGFRTHILCIGVLDLGQIIFLSKPQSDHLENGRIG